MAKAIFATATEAVAAESGNRRAYRVRHGVDEVFVVALSPREAVGIAGQEFGLQAELLDPKYPTLERRGGLDAALAGLPPHRRRAIRERLEELLKGVKG